MDKSKTNKKTRGLLRRNLTFIHAYYMFKVQSCLQVKYPPPFSVFTDIFAIYTNFFLNVEKDTDDYDISLI